MSPHRIEYVDLYVRDREDTVRQLTRLGFRAVGESPREAGDRRSTVLRGGEAQLVVTSPLRDGPVSEYLDRHGDGVADIAMSCADLEATMARIRRAGVRPLVSTRAAPDGTATAAVPGFGPVRHTLLQRDPDAPVAPPPGTRPVAGTAAGPGAVRACDHVAVCLPTGALRRTVATYEEAFGLERYSGEYIEVGAQAMDSVVVRSPSGGVTFTLIEPAAGHEPGQIDGFLARNAGPGVQHLAFLVDDLVRQVRTLRAEGAEFIPTPDAYYRTLTERVGDLAETVEELRDAWVLADRDEWGYLLQIFMRSPFPRSTLFYELIQRHDARGFGTDNIRALYEAVARDGRIPAAG
ncbi:4-hydroxyphenylpyruvate dioxygenase [Actinomadura sp. DC4]|uniref:4-hydroxyphenylpyruvate dioxygenase n=1 Tax=Actinomadura sp. DC4 TaxID=3055069 RepID=UPI0025B0A0C1|nr:4-hydroxyphenylpyruvate dioxygenase [Actinomadura sp. DC4]MDN3358160.1 4-hydroxyphenylpyruvate dioxygenase [Actinomadura sp. DC4]